ncbi:gastrin/cholecystokinin-like peptide [Dunckerocampus dactyliophorus]|uniref:gastrin/cholecystokinin-like peptide n=1 Tax=Dunckerocampus dactyliophorus TaxID=161453 RepID=UPI00240737F5|nr:gastrin/cholecystokinin-like peptide [Dunckerocampus dactyliophorus]XP_054634583.1 gastrin/cholecystokinin-like peptide [Dunckerocampus dactyliophorus]
MSWNTMAACALVLVLLASAAEAESRKVEQLQARREAARDLAGRQESPRTERRARLTEDEREIITKQVMQAISEVVNSDCMLDRDYRGWLDFGRRNAE